MKKDSNKVNNSDSHNESDRTDPKNQTTQLPGIDNSQVIPSFPYLIKENSQHISNEEDSKHIPKWWRK